MDNVNNKRPKQKSQTTRMFYYLLLTALFGYIHLAIAFPVNDHLLNAGGPLPLSKDGNSAKAPNIYYANLTSSWTNFYFTNTGSYAATGNPLDNTFFTALLSIGIYCVQVTDLYCAGDRFGLYDGFGIPSFAANSTTPGAVSCDYSSIDPNYTIQNSTWSSLSYDLFIPVPIPITFTVSVIASPFSAGQAAIRILNGTCPTS